MRETTFNFESVELAKLGNKTFRQRGVTVNVKSGTITFSKQYVTTHNLDGHHLKFFVDIKKSALGWTIVKQASFLSELKEYKQLKLSKAGIYLLSIATALRQFKFNPNVKSFKGLQVKKYLSTYNSISTTIYYVILKYNETTK